MFVVLSNQCLMYLILVGDGLPAYDFISLVKYWNVKVCKASTFESLEDSSYLLIPLFGFLVLSD